MMGLVSPPPQASATSMRWVGAALFLSLSPSLLLAHFFFLYIRKYVCGSNLKAPITRTPNQLHKHHKTFPPKKHRRLRTPLSARRGGGGGGNSAAHRGDGSSSEEEDDGAILLNEKPGGWVGMSGLCVDGGGSTGGRGI